MKVKNLIFDLGGVIVDLAVEKTVEAFAHLSGKPHLEIIESYRKHPEFFAYERGELTDTEFRDFVRHVFSFRAKDEAIDNAWNAMITGLPRQKLDLLEQLKKDYAVIVLSNTNDIHMNFINEQMLPKVSSQPSLDYYFHSHYYSHKVGKRKPEPEIFLQVLEENDYQPHESLFLDDRKENIHAAESLGIQTKWVESPDQVFDFFKNL